MGFLSKVGKGIKKAFKKVGKFVGKIASSKFGKILLIAAAVFTLGTALIAGAGAFASTAGGFAAKFVAAGKAFVGALASPLKTAKGLFNGAGSTAASAAGTGATAGAASATAEVAGAVGAAAPAATPIGALAGEGVAAGAGAGAAAGAVELAPLAAPTLAAPAAPGISLASQAASAAGKVANFATSAQGLTLAGNAAQGFAAGKAQEKAIEEQRREREFYDNQYRDPAKIKQLNDAAAKPINLSGGFIDRARQVSEFMNGRPGSGTSAQPGNPNDTYGRYVVGY